MPKTTTQSKLNTTTKQSRPNRTNLGLHQMAKELTNLLEGGSIKLLDQEFKLLPTHGYEAFMEDRFKWHYSLKQNLTIIAIVQEITPEGKIKVEYVSMLPWPKNPEFPPKTEFTSEEFALLFKLSPFFPKKEQA